MESRSKFSADTIHSSINQSVALFYARDPRAKHLLGDRTRWWVTNSLEVTLRIKMPDPQPWRTLIFDASEVHDESTLTAVGTWVVEQIDLATNYIVDLKSIDYIMTS